MKIKSTLLVGLFVTSTFANDFTSPSYRPGENNLFASTRIIIDSAEQTNERDNTNDDYKVSADTTRVSQNLQFGLNKNLALIADIDYVMSQDIENDGTDTKASGIERVSLGASYRVSSYTKLPFILDAFGKFSPSIQNKDQATSNDDGSANSGGHEITLGSRLTKGQFYFDFTFNYLMEQAVDSASTGDEIFTVEPYTIIDFVIGYQIRPVDQLNINLEGLLTRVGEEEQSFQGGSNTLEAHYNFGFNILAQYKFLDNLTADLGLQYLLGMDYNIDASQDQTVNEFSQSRISIGSTYLF